MEITLTLNGQSLWETEQAYKRMRAALEGRLEIAKQKEAEAIDYRCDIDFKLKHIRSAIEAIELTKTGRLGIEVET